MKTDYQIIKQFKDQRGQSRRGLSKQYANTKDCQAFYAGDFMEYRDQIQFTDTAGRRRRAMVQFNRVKPYINAVRGFSAQNRRNAKYNARLMDQVPQQLYSKYANALKDYVRMNCNADQIETRQVGDQLICGYGAVETAMTYGEGYSTRDPNGEIIMGNLDPECVWWDPYARATNLLDARWVGYEKIYHLEEALDLFDTSTPDDFDQDMDDDNRSDIVIDPATDVNYRVLEGYDWANVESSTVKVNFYQWYEIETFYRCANPLKAAAQNPSLAPAVAVQLQMIAQEAAQDDEDGLGLFKFNPQDEILNFDGTIKAKMTEAFGDSIEVFSFKKRVYYTAVLSGDKVFDKFHSQSQQGFSVQFLTGDWDAKNKIWVGMVNSMKEPTLYYNKSLTEILFILAANSKGGVMAERSAIDDVQEFEQNFARTDATVIVNDGAISGNTIKSKRDPYTPSGYENIVTLSDAAIAEVSGVDKSFLGSSENKDDTAALNRQRIKQVMSTLACYFDSITLYQKENARILLDFLKVYAENNAGGLFRILGDDGKQQFIQLAADNLAAEYDVDIAEAPTTPDEKSEQASVLTTMAQGLMAMQDPTGKAVLAIALKYMPLEAEDIQQLSQILAPPQQQVDPAQFQQLQQQVQQLTSQASQVQLAEVVSKTQLNQVKAKQTLSDINKSAVDAAKTMEDTEQTRIENNIARQLGANGIKAQINLSA